MNPLEYSLAGVIAAALAWGGVGHYQKNSYKADLAVANQKLIVCKFNEAECKRNLRFQNQAIEDQRIEYEGRLANFEPVTITETIIKYVPKEVNVTRTD